MPARIFRAFIAVCALGMPFVASAQGPADMFRSSLPNLDGEASIVGLDAPATLERDDRGILTVTAGSEFDAYRALGYAHAQDRLFQMDAARRAAAGRLSEWIGRAGLGEDQIARRLFLPQAAERALEQLSDRERAALTAYTEGVNAGRESLAALPPEYILLGVQPEPWREVDSVLVYLGMCRYLSSGGWTELQLNRLKQSYPEQLVEFLALPYTRFTTVNEVRHFGRHAVGGMQPPGSHIIDLRDRIGQQHKPLNGVTLAASDVHPMDRPQNTDSIGALIGSNNWAVGGARTHHGGAILANDMHLMLTVPGTWYHADLRWPNTRMVGVTLPGVPGIVSGSNEHVAWGFTNVQGDFIDHVLIETDPEDQTHYLTPEGPKAFGETTIEIAVRGAEPYQKNYQTTIWGPVTATVDGQPAVRKWSCTEPGGVNFAILDFAPTRTTNDAIKVAARWFGPPQNVVMADRHGDIALVVSGYIPNRIGFDGSLPTSWASGQRRWNGSIPEHDRVILRGSGTGRLISANSRVTADLRKSKILGEPYSFGMRAWEIERVLMDLQIADESEHYDVQLDTRATFADFYKDLLLQAVAVDGDDAQLRAARAAALAWDGRADLDSEGLGFLLAFRSRLRNKVMGAIRAHYSTAEQPAAPISWPLLEEPLRVILDKQPEHMLPPEFDSWSQLLADAARETVAAFDRQGASPDDPWSQSQRVAIEHPLQLALNELPLPRPMLEWADSQLGFPEMGLPGSWMTIRVQSGDFGASQRMVVSPGRESDGILALPCGQSGHPLSPFYRTSHDAWVNGTPASLEPGEPIHTLKLVPGQ